jgi:hypothetical protein
MIVKGENLEENVEGSLKVRELVSAPPPEGAIQINSISAPAKLLLAMQCDVGSTMRSRRLQAQRREMRARAIDNIHCV